LYKYRQPVVAFDWDKFAHKVLVGNVTCDIVYIDIYTTKLTNQLTNQLTSNLVTPLDSCLPVVLRTVSRVSIMFSIRLSDVEIQISYKSVVLTNHEHKMDLPPDDQKLFVSSIVFESGVWFL